ncbi:MAG: abortive infection family protein [Syntrophales bacterium]|nr:abortive infection family protein [Syntrophales bacterium]
MALLPQESVFVMHGARVAVAGGLLHIEEQVKALELAVVENTGLAFDLAKTLIESVCRTIIKERGNILDKDDDLPKLFKTASFIVPFLPVSLASDAAARKSLQQTLSGLNTAVQGVCELRNAFGFASHGSAEPRPPMEGVQALLVAQAADAIIGFLYRVHSQDLARPRTVALNYADRSDFNDWIDDQTEPVQILTLPPYRASEVLFNVDQEAYRDLLSQYKTEDETDVQAEQVGEVA